MKVIFILFIFNFNIYYIHAQDLFPVKRNGLFGYCNKEKEIIIPFQFEDATDFDKNFAIVTKNKKEGLINKKGEFIIPPNYYSIDFRSLYFEDTAVLEVYTLQNEGEDKMQTFIGKDQKWIKKKYENVEINTDQSISFFKKYNSRIGRKYKNGKTKLIFKEKQNDEGYCECWRYNAAYYEQLKDANPIFKNNKVGFRNEEKSPAFLKDTTIFKPHSKNKYHKDSLKIFLRYVHIPPFYDSIRRLNEKEFLVRNNNKYGIVNTINKIIVPIEYDSINFNTKFINGYKTYNNNLVGGIFYSRTSDSTFKIPSQYQQILTTDQIGFLVAKKNDDFGLINYQNETIIPFQFKNIKLFYHLKKIAEIQTINLDKNLYDIQQQKIVFPNQQFSEIKYYSDYENANLIYQFLTLKEANKYELYFPNSTKNFSFQADSIFKLDGNFIDNIFLLKYKLNELWGLIKVDVKNETVEFLDAKYDSIMPGNVFGDAFQKGLITVELKSKNIERGYIDIFGNEYFPDK